MKKVWIFGILIVICFTLVGCHSSNEENKPKEKSGDLMSTISVLIGEKNYSLLLEDNETAVEFLKILPQEYEMKDLNQNEKYVYLKESLPMSSYSPKQIQKGDVMLYGEDCLVIFYKSFETTYSYTKIGYIEDLEDLGEESILVFFQKEK